MAEEAVIHCVGCGKELFRGENPALGIYAAPYCPNCTADDAAEAEWEAQLEDRFLRDQWDLYIRSQEELSRKADMG